MFDEPKDSAVEGEAFGDVKALRAEINELAGHRNAIDGRVVDIAIGLLGDDCWKGEGLETPEKFLAFRCGLTAATARRYVDVAHRADELPEAVDALRRGELSLDQLMPIVRRVPGWADGQVLRLSKKLTVGQINAVINKYNFARSGPPHETPASDTAADESTVDPTESGDLAPEAPIEPDDTSAGADESAAPAIALIPKDRCWMGVGDDGRWRLNLETTPELGAIIESAVDEARDRIFRTSGNLVTDAEALADVAERSLGAIDDDARRDRFRIGIHLNVDGQATDHLDTPIPDVIRLHLTCDGLLAPVFYENGVPVSVGRGQRIVPERTRRLVIKRDHGCAVPGCGATRHLEVHHITHWSDGGVTDTFNLVTLCSHHHRMHHHGRLGVRGNPDQGTMVFTNSRGVNLANDGPEPEPPTESPPPPKGVYEKPLGERLDMDYVSFVHPKRLEWNAKQAAASRARNRANWAQQAERNRRARSGA